MGYTSMFCSLAQYINETIFRTKVDLVRFFSPLVDNFEVDTVYLNEVSSTIYKGKRGLQINRPHLEQMNFFI